MINENIRLRTTNTTEHDSERFVEKGANSNFDILVMHVNSQSNRNKETFMVIRIHENATAIIAFVEEFLIAYFFTDNTVVSN